MEHVGMGLKEGVYMKIAMRHSDGSMSYYRKQGIYCFDFVWEKDLASDLTIEECEQITANADTMCKLYGADELSVVE